LRTCDRCKILPQHRQVSLSHTFIVSFFGGLMTVLLVL